MYYSYMEVHDQHSDQIQTLTNGAEKGRLDKGKLLSLTLSPTSVSSFLKIIILSIWDEIIKGS